MAISKERLEELIEQEGTIWVAYDEDRIGKIKLVVRMYGVSVDEYNKLHDCEPMLYSQFCGIFKDICPISCTFETKSEAEEYLEFGNVTRTNTLKMPSWEEFNKGHILMFYNNWSKFYLYNAKNNFNNYEKIIRICEDKYIDNVGYVQKEHTIIFEQPLTKENYDNARRLCVKLFRGESV